jgi:hypothetical protein
MLVFSEIHDWQLEPGVRQILAFSTPEMKDLFEREMADRFDKAMDGYAGVDKDYSTKVKSKLSDSNAGAVYKLRAVLNGSDKWVPVIRCGITGGQIGQDGPVENSVEEALRSCLQQLHRNITQPIIDMLLLIERDIGI